MGCRGEPHPTSEANTEKGTCMGGTDTVPDESTTSAATATRASMSIETPIELMRARKTVPGSERLDLMRNQPLRRVPGCIH
jgi:hypothetical protein